MTERLPVKDPGESVVVLFDFSAETASVSSPSVTSSVRWSLPGDASPSAVLDGAPSISGSNAAHVLQRVDGGVDLTDYALRCTAMSAEGDVLVVPAVLPVRLLP